MAKKDTLVCKPCGYSVLVSDIGGAVIECYACGTELLPKARPAARKPAATKARPAKAAVKKPATRKKK
jgi:DNA-directed RNA polymerase subunit RPC12/RpoP